MNDLPKILGSLGQGLQSYTFKTCRRPFVSETFWGTVIFLRSERKSWCPSLNLTFAWKLFLYMRTLSWLKRLFWAFMFSPNHICSLCKVSPLILLTKLEKSRWHPQHWPEITRSSLLGTYFFIFHFTTGSSFAKLCYTIFPCGSAGKESACNAGDLGSISGLGRSPGEGKGYPLQYSGLENSMDCI